MSDPTQVEVPETNYLEMSDEDIMKATAPELVPIKPVAAVVADTPDGEVDPAAAVVPAEGANPDATVDDEVDLEDEGEGGDGKDGAGDKPKPDAAASTDPVEKKPAATDVDPAKTVPEKKPVVEAAAIDFEAELKRVLAPFKANGREIEVKSVDDAISLMQMGANYNKKMAALKPNLKLMKMLETSGFMSEEKIGFLIDLGKKDPAAINKLVQEAGIDPMELDAEKAKTYKQSTFAAGDQELELDTVLDEISTSPTYTQTLDIVSKKWDSSSKQVIADSPQLLKVINSHVEAGIYDLIAKEVEGERLFGRLKGLTDIEAYRQVGDALQLKGAFNHLGKTQGQPSAAAAVVVQPKPSKVDDGKLKEKRRAASSTKPAASATPAADFNPLALSDEDFARLAAPKF